MHPSLLPRHRGCSSVPWAIIEGDEETGVTHHYIDQGVDTGRILSQVRTPIYARETQADLYERLMRIGAASWPQALEEVLKGAPGMVQEGESCYHKRGAPFSGQIDDAWPIDQIERFIRAMTYPPYPFATYHGREIHNLAEYLALVDDSSRWPKPSEVAANG
jgi:methionyl-tRNA formyltransferase